ncbi:MAG: GntR family transcriptional regulator, partial [Rhizobiaceae bacterium]
MSTIVARGSRGTHSDDGRESSIAAQVHDVLMERILDMELPPFEELSEARLAAEFGVSRTPVREALARLA